MVGRPSSSKKMNLLFVPNGYSFFNRLSFEKKKSGKCTFNGYTADSICCLLNSVMFSVADSFKSDQGIFSYIRKKI